MAQVKVTQRIGTPGSGTVSRYRALLLTHRSLDEKLASALQRRRPDFALVQRLERRKLGVEDELAEFRRLLAAGSLSLRRTVGPGGVHPPLSGDGAELDCRRSRVRHGGTVGGSAFQISAR